MSQTLPKPTMTLMEAIDAMRDGFEKGYGRLLTEEEAVQWVDEIREDLKHRRKKKMLAKIKQPHRMSCRNKDAMIWCEKDEWFQIDEKNNRFVLTPNAPQIARDSFEKYKRINNLNWS